MSTDASPIPGLLVPPPQHPAGVAETVLAGVDALSDGFIVFEPTGEVVYVNPALARPLGFDRLAIFPPMSPDSSTPTMLHVPSDR